MALCYIDTFLPFHREKLDSHSCRDISGILSPTYYTSTHNMSYSFHSHSMHTMSPITNPNLVFCLLGLCGFLVPGCLVCKIASDFGECYPFLPLVGGTLTALRTGIRERHGISGSICEDLICITCCFQCTLCQMARELQARR
uniref:Uncharacterized protein n=1 Tax=Leptobrachium leishanense TaxID=445787 RepID=A0A8C5QK67_9ANUR